MGVRQVERGGTGHLEELGVSLKRRGKRLPGEERLQEAEGSLGPELRDL